MSSITQQIRDGAMTVRRIADAVRETKVGADIPYRWMQIVDGRIDRLRDIGFWTRVAELPDYRATRCQKRYFPIATVGPENKELKQIAETVHASHYGNADRVNAHYANYGEFKELTNMQAIPVRDPATPVNFDEDEFRACVEVYSLAEMPERVARAVYILCTAYDYCHLIYTNSYVIAQVEALLGGPHRDLILNGLRYANMILAHEEEVTRTVQTDLSMSQRFVFTLTQLKNVTWLPLVAPLDLDINPLITLCPYGESIYNRLALYVAGTRSIASHDEIRTRIRVLTGAAFDGIDDKWNWTTDEKGVRTRRDYVVLCGSSITQVAGNTPLGDFKECSELYYSKSDFDVLIAQPSYKKFIEDAVAVIGDIDRNLGGGGSYDVTRCVSGMRISFTHPRLPRSFEIFRSPKTPLKLVSQFHVPVVKAYWNFQDLIMCRSFVVSMLTGVCESFDWFSNNKNAVFIILKNAQRGYATHLNVRELLTVEKLFASEEKVWGYYPIAKMSLITGVHDRRFIFFRTDGEPLGLRYGQDRQAVDFTLTSAAHAPAIPIEVHKLGSGDYWHVASP